MSSVDDHLLRDLLELTATTETSDANRFLTLLALALPYASNARAARLPDVPGFLAEQAEQINILRRCIDLIEQDVPDLEGERLFRSDPEAAIRNLLEGTIKPRVS